MSEPWTSCLSAIPPNDASARALGGAQRSSQIVLRFSHIAFANVMPAQAGIHASWMESCVDPRLRGDDG